RLDPVARSLEGRLDRSVGLVRDPAAQPERARAELGVLTEAHALYASANANPHAEDLSARRTPPLRPAARSGTEPSGAPPAPRGCARRPEGAAPSGRRPAPRADPKARAARRASPARR